MNIYNALIIQLVHVDVKENFVSFGFYISILSLYKDVFSYCVILDQVAVMVCGQCVIYLCSHD